MMNPENVCNRAESVVCRFDVRQAPYGGYHTSITNGGFTVSLVEEFADRWSHVEAPAALGEQCSLYVRRVRAEPDGDLSCLSYVSSELVRSVRAVWATHVLVAEDGRRVLKRFDLPARLLTSRGVVSPACSLTPSSVEKFVDLLGPDAAVALVSALHQVRGNQVVLVGPTTGSAPLRCEQRLWALRVALWLVSAKLWPTSWAVLGSRSYACEEDDLQLLWYPGQPVAQSGSCMIELGHPDVKQARRGVLWLNILENWFRSGDFTRVVRVARRLNRWDADPSDDETAWALAQCSGGTSRTPSALLDVANVAESLCPRPSCSVRLRLRAVRAALGFSPPDAGFAYNAIEDLRRCPPVWRDARLVANMPVARLLDTAFAAGGRQPERVLSLLTTWPGLETSLQRYLGNHPNILAKWLSTSTGELRSAAMRRLAHRLFAYAGISPTPVFRWLIENDVGNRRPCFTAALLSEFWSYPACRRFSVEQGLCRRLLETEGLTTETWIDLSARYLAELASNGSLVELRDQIRKDLLRAAESPEFADQWLAQLLAQAGTPGVAVSLMQAVRQTHLEPDVEDRLMRSLWAHGGLPDTEAAFWAERCLMDRTVRNGPPHAQTFWLDKAIRIHLRTLDGSALVQLLARDELAENDELAQVLLALLDGPEDSHRALLWAALAKARSFRFNVALLEECTHQARPDQGHRIHRIARRLLTTHRSRLATDDLTAYRQLERLVLDHRDGFPVSHELASAFADAATHLLERFGSDDQPRSLVRSRARWRRQSRPRRAAFMARVVRDLIALVADREPFR